MNRKWFHYKILCIFLAPLGLLLTFLGASNPSIVEKFYSQGFYLMIRRFVSLPARLLPFSLGEMLVYIFFLLLILIIVKFIVEILKERRIKILVGFMMNILAIFSCLYFIFVLSWGLNYQRMPFGDLAGLEVKPTSIDTLEELCDQLIDNTNKLRQEITEDQNGIAYIPDGFNNVAQRVHLGFEALQVKYPFLSMKHTSKAKGVLFSEGLSYAGIGGVYFPFTAEANVNIKLPHSMLPNTVSHEIAHQLGFAREDEANYIAYLACISHPHKDFQYSGYLLALIHSMDAMHKHHPEIHRHLTQKYSLDVKRDIMALNQFWDSYQGPIKDASSKMNNAYLKSNLQEDGVNSYGRMVDLLIAEFGKSNVQK